MVTRRTAKQLTLPIPNTWGGRRRGAGRKPNGAKPGVAHLKRPTHKKRFPLLVTMAIARDVGRLRTKHRVKAIETAMLWGRERFGFRLVHYSIQNDHLHLMVEANDKRALSRGMQSLSIRIARGINRRLDRRGRVFRDRYHARPLRTPLEVRHALLYTLNNAKKHAAQHGRTFPPAMVDPFSSAPHFTGWSRPVSTYGELPPPIGSPPKTWLLLRGYAQRGPLDPDAVPNAAHHRAQTIVARDDAWVITRPAAKTTSPQLETKGPIDSCEHA